MREWLAAAGWRGFHQVRCGRLVDSFGAKVIAADAPLGKCALGSFTEVPIPPSRRALPSLDAKQQRDIAEELLPKLLQLRVDCCRLPKAAEPGDVGPTDQEDCFANRILTYVGGAPGLREQLRQLMEAEPEDNVRLSDPRVVLLEVLLARCHETGRDKIYVAEVAADVNAARDEAGATSTFSDRLIGSLIKSVGLLTHPLGRKGRGLRLNSATRRTIHRLARSYDVPSAAQPFPGCCECSRPQDIET
jgi:hypothetical protein